MHPGSLFAFRGIFQGITKIEWKIIIWYMANIVSNTPYIKLIDKSDRGSEMNVQEK